MLFNHIDLKDLNHQLEYIDTAIIPVVDVDYSGQLKNIVDAYEIIQAVTMQVESQFKGRVLLVPPVQISGDSTLANKIAEDLKRFGMKHILFVSPQTTQLETAETIFKVNVFPIETMDENFKREMIDSQIKNLMKEIIGLWNM